MADADGRWPLADADRGIFCIYLRARARAGPGAGGGAHSIVKLSLSRV